MKQFGQAKLSQYVCEFYENTMIEKGCISATNEFVDKSKTFLEFFNYLNFLVCTFTHEIFFILSIIKIIQNC